MPRKKKTGTEPTLEETLAEIKRKHQHLDPEFVNLFVDVVYRMAIEVLKEEKNESKQKC